MAYEKVKRTYNVAAESGCPILTLLGSLCGLWKGETYLYLSGRVRMEHPDSAWKPLWPMKGWNVPTLQQHSYGRHRAEREEALCEDKVLAGREEHSKHTVTSSHWYITTLCPIFMTIWQNYHTKLHHNDISVCTFYLLRYWVQCCHMNSRSLLGTSIEYCSSPNTLVHCIFVCLTH